MRLWPPEDDPPWRRHLRITLYWIIMLVYLLSLLLVGYLAFEAMRLGL